MSQLRARPLLDRRRLASLSVLLVSSSLLSVGCSGGPEVEPYLASALVVRPEPARGELAAELARVESLRAGLDLAASRELALALAAENPVDARALLIASRAESDRVFALPEDDKEGRSLAALGSLELARRAVAAGGEDAETWGQLAWSLGTTTHLQPMFDRSEHAQETLDAIESALALDREQVVALATLSVLRLRLATLPWIARVMAWGAPEGNVEEATDVAAECVRILPSLEHRLLLAKALVAAERTRDARRILDEALKTPDTYPRDAELRPLAQRLREEIAEE